MLQNRLSHAISKKAVRRLRRVALLRAVKRTSVARTAVPVSAEYGFDRGTPIDRHYVETFLARYAGNHGYAVGLIAGRVLEIGGREYADRYGAGSDETPLVIDVLHENEANPEATIVGDIAQPHVLPEAAFDCIICTQTLPVLWDVPAAMASMHRALRPGGTLLVTVPGITKALNPDRDHWGDWWRFTSSSMRRLAVEAFPEGRVEVESYGNLLAATLFLHGYAAEELSRGELNLRDPDYEVTITLRAVKAA